MAVLGTFTAKNVKFLHSRSFKLSKILNESHCALVTNLQYILKPPERWDHEICVYCFKE